MHAARVDEVRLRVVWGGEKLRFNKDFKNHSWAQNLVKIMNIATTVVGNDWAAKISWLRYNDRYSLSQCSEIEERMQVQPVWTP